MSIDNTCVVSGFWPIKGNPKVSAGTHVEEVQKKDYIDYFYSSVGVSLPNAYVVEFLHKDMPSRSLASNLKNIKGKEASVKWGKDIDGDVFYRLASIWLSKPFFLWKAYMHDSSYDRYMWVDCGRDVNVQQCAKSNAPVFVAKYPYQGRGFPPKKPFNNFMGWGWPVGWRKLNRFTDWYMGGTFSISRKHLPIWFDLYKQTLAAVDRKFKLYDEELVLSYMYNSYYKPVRSIGLGGFKSSELRRVR